MARALRAGSLSVAALAGLAIVFAASGWLYVIATRSDDLGPRIGDALPLDELSGRSAAPLILFVGVWAAAAVLLGLVARAVRAERLTAALLLALAVGIWGYLETAVSILVVRQIPAEDAFRAAAGVHAVYVPAALAGLAGALLGRSRRPAHPQAPVLVASFVAAAGLLGVVDALFPEHSRTLLAVLAPGARPLARSLEGPLGLALLSVAPGLARRRARAWQLAVGLLAGSTALHVLHSDYGAAPTGLLALALVSRKHVFDAPGDPRAKPRIAVRAALFAAAIYGYGAAALWANRVAADQPFTRRFALRETTRALLGLGLRGSPHLSGPFAHWFGISVLLLGLACAASLVHAWLAPWRYRLAEGSRAAELTRALVQAWGVDTLAPFVLRADKSYFFDEQERAFLAYRVVASVAIVSGDPIGPTAAFPALLDRFIAFARERDWRIAVLGASERCLPLYRTYGLRALYHGDEAVIDVERFSLEGRPIRKVRQSVHRLTRAGYRPLVVHPREIGPDLRRELEAIARAWRGAEPERGFVMALDALFRLEHEDAVFVIGLAPDGSAQGFLHFAVCPAAQALSLSSMPRLRNTPNGFNEWLVCEAVEWARRQELQRSSLNFAPFAALLAPDAELSALQKVERRALLALKGHFQLDNLLLFNRKFFPSWQPRFVVYERKLDLPRVGIAALAAEAYLPFVRRAAS
jgi:lysyl-tRNA synthetase, class II